MSNSAILQARLEEAEEAYHQLLTGAKAVSVNIGGYGATTYAAVDAAKLKSYIEYLKGKINNLSGKPRRGLIRVEF